jgi:hypothetical protein
MIATPELTEEDLRDYFEELGDCDAGLTGSQCSCPIAQYYAVKHELDVVVNGLSIWFFSLPGCNQELPLWATAFVRMADKAYDNRFITGHQAKSILNQAVESANRKEAEWNRQ